VKLPQKPTLATPKQNYFFLDLSPAVAYNILYNGPLHSPNHKPVNPGRPGKTGRLTMKQQRHNPRPNQNRHRPTDADANRTDPTPTAGFTLIEVVVVIFILGVLSAAAITNWSTFMRHQELRGDAMHKEIMALKARAIEHGADLEKDTAVFRTPSHGSNTYVIKWFAPSATNPENLVLVEREVKLNNDVRICTDTGFNMSQLGELPNITISPYTTGKSWKSTNPSTPNAVKIVVKPDNINAYADNWAEGRIVLLRKGVKAQYCIQKEQDNIKPELYYRSKDGGPWKRL